MFESTKKFGPISTGHRQWRDDSHCRYIHGYGRYVEFTFACNELDAKTWVVDFGGLKSIKQWIDAAWDHRTLIASDDPQLKEILDMEAKGLLNVNIMDVTQGWSPSIEGSCKYLYDNLNPRIELMTDGRCWISCVRIWEHENNSAIYRP